MEWYIPTHIYSEPDCIRKHAKELVSYGKKAMLVTGGSSSKKNGSLAAVQEQFDAAGIPYVCFDGIEENPSVETVMKARDLGVAAGVDHVIGIGGGSPMDAAKAISMMIANPELGEDVLYQKCNLSYLPVIEVPTTAGTGSEVTPWSILTMHEKRTKAGIPHAIYPTAAFVDSTYLHSLPHKGLISTAVDALCHLVESSLVNRATDYSRFFCERGLRLFGGCMQALKEGNMTAEQYEALMQASTLAGMAIAHTGTGLPHALSYRITYELHIPHGAACGKTIAGFVKNHPDQKRVQEVLAALSLPDCEAFATYMQEVLSAWECPEAFFREDVHSMMENAAKLSTWPGTITEETMLKFL